MQYPNLLNKSIFPIPVGDRYLVYAPLTDHVDFADSDRLHELESAAGQKNDGHGVLLDRMQNTALFGKKMYSINKPDDYLLLYILPNYKCNFSCAYCFSAKGRSNKEIDLKKLKAALDFFVDSTRVKEKKLYITFLGGGEPMLSWKIVKYGIEYAHFLANNEGIRLMVEIVTNGSFLNGDMLKTLVQYNVRVRVSFEALEDIQSVQRGSYDKVCQTIKQLTEAHLYLEMRAMITPLNVERMEEMVSTLIQSFSGIGYYMFDPITDKNTFNDVEKVRSFCEKYLDHFFRALDIALHHGKQLTCAPLRNINSLVKRYCHGEFCVTPEGTITICHRVSSPFDSNYQNCIYGKINDAEKVEFDYEKYALLMNTDTIYDNPDCETCFIKWNCGGGCMVHNREYRIEIRRVFCEFVRNFSKELLLRRAIKEVKHQVI